MRSFTRSTTQSMMSQDQVFAIDLGDGAKGKKGVKKHGRRESNIPKGKLT